MKTFIASELTVWIQTERNCAVDSAKYAKGSLKKHSLHN